MFLIPLWPKETNHFPLFAFVLLGLNILAFLVGWPLQRRQMSNVDQDDISLAAQKLVLVLQEPESGIGEADKSALSEEMAKTPFPSEQMKQLFNRIQHDPNSLSYKARYEWDLVYPVFESYTRTASVKPLKGNFFERWGFKAEGAWMPGLLTHQFLHEGFAHFLFNMLFLFMAAIVAEAVLSWHVVWLYIAGGAAAAFAQVQAGIPSGQILVGASGAISALMGFCLIARPSIQVKLFYFVLLIVIPKYGVFDCPLWFFLPVWLITQFLLAMLAAHAPAQTAYAAHIGGFVFGALVGVAWRSFEPAGKSPLV